jgi:hypothetical protein
VSRKKKLLAAIRANPKAVRFEDACRLALLLWGLSMRAARVPTGFSSARASRFN